MKRLVSISALLAASLAMAQSSVELTPQIGYNVAEKNLHLKNYKVYGGEIQYNGFDFALKPEFTYYYSLTDYEDNFENYVDNADTNVKRFALNGVYEWENVKNVTPLAKVGIGYETMDSAYGGNSAHSGFVDAGVGAKYPFNDFVALKLEAIYMLKHNDARYDNNLLLMLGLNFTIDGSTQKAAPAQPAKIVPPVVKPVKIDNDIDKDGVINKLDECPNTPLGLNVDAKGCTKIVNLHLNFKSDSTELADGIKNNTDEFVKFLKIEKEYKVQIIGHSDSSGNSKHNLELSKRRAEAIKKLLVADGIDAKRITTLGKGDTQPLVSNATKEGRAKNRRIEANLIK